MDKQQRQEIKRRAVEHRREMPWLKRHSTGVILFTLFILFVVLPLVGQQIPCVRAGTC